MPLQQGSDEKTISANIAELIKAGHSKEQAAAIAYKLAGKTEKNSPTIGSVHVNGPLEEKLFVAKGNPASRILITKGPPTPVERLRGEAFVNDERLWLRKYLLEPLGLKREDVLVSWCEDRAELEAFAKGAQLDAVISVSKLLKLDTEQRGRWNWPELSALVLAEERFAPELARKCVALKKTLDVTPALAPCFVKLVESGRTPTDTSHIAPVKKSKPTKQIVYGVVLDPYVVDAHNDWICPEDIEKTAHNFIKKYRTITLQHEEVAPDAVVLESFIEDYPSQTDYLKAHANEPHRAFARMYGNARIHSGAWVMGVQLSDRLWKQYERGEIGAFSIEGFGVRENLTMTAMPSVKFVELGEVAVVIGQEDPKARLT